MDLSKVVVSEHKNPNVPKGQGRGGGAWPWGPTVRYPEPGEKITPEHLVELMRDSKFFRERFMWIIDPSAKKVPFIQRPAQDHYYRHKTTHDLILKARKMGFSSEIESDFLYMCMTRENINAVTMAHRDDDTKVHLQRIRYFIDTCGTQDVKFEITVTRDNATEIYLPMTNSYYWIGTAGARGWGRGRTINLLHLSEVSHYADQSVMTGVLEAVPQGPTSRRVLETTANGVGDAFYEMWCEASDESSSSPWTPHFFAWWNDPYYTAQKDNMPANLNLDAREQMMVDTLGLSPEQVVWYRHKKASMPDKALMEQEFPTTPMEAFVSSGRNIFDLRAIADMESKASDRMWQGELQNDGADVKFIENPDGRMKMWRRPVTGRKYLIGADIALGVRDGAFSVAAVFDRASHEVVAQWRWRVDPEKFGNILVDLALYYNNAILVPENNNMGRVTIQAIINRRYPHLVKPRMFWDDAPDDWGVTTNERTKAQFISALRTALSEMSYIDHSKTALNEMRAAVYDEQGKMVSNRERRDGRAEKGAHLDCVMARGIGLFALGYLTIEESYRIMDREDDHIMVSHLAPGVARWSRSKGRAL